MASDEESVCRRLALLAPELPIERTAKVIELIKDGDTIALCENYNVPRREAAAILSAVRRGIPAYQAVAAYLDRVGVPKSDDGQPTPTTES